MPPAVNLGKAKIDTSNSSSFPGLGGEEAKAEYPPPIQEIPQETPIYNDAELLLDLDDSWKTYIPVDENGKVYFTASLPSSLMFPWKVDSLPPNL
jgi:hypothetical protein